MNSHSCCQQNRYFHQWIAYRLLLAAVLMLILPHRNAAASDPTRNLPVSIQILLNEVREAMHQKDYPGAVRKIIAFQQKEAPHTDDAAATKVCCHPVVCYALGNCYLLQSDYAHAEAAYRKALETVPDYLDVQVNLAKTYCEMERYREAADYFQKAYTVSDPKHPDYLYYSAVSCLMGNHHAPAITKFKTLFQTHPDAVTVPWKENYAHALLSAGHLEKAVPIIIQLTGETIGEKKIHWQEILLQTYLQMKQTDRALSYATQLARTDCLVDKWWKALTHIHLTLEKYRHALADLTILGYLKPLTRDERKLWADLCLQLEIPDKAAPVYENLLTDPADQVTDKQLMQRLVAAYRQLDMSETAVERIDRFFPDNNDPELLMLKGDLLYTLKRFKDADITYRRAARKNSQRAGQAWLMAGYAAWQQNDVTASRKAFEQAARFKRQRKDAMTAMAQLEKRIN